MRQSQLWNKCAVRADSVHVRHAFVEVNVVIGVLLCGLLVGVRVVPIVVCDAAVLIHFVLIALTVAFVFSKNFAVLEVYCLQLVRCLKAYGVAVTLLRVGKP